MVNVKLIEELAQRVDALIPGGLKEAAEDLRGNLRPALQAGLARFDLVTREEFEVQRSLLQRTRAKLDALEQRLKELEQIPPG